MFGSKQAKQERLSKAVDVIRARGEVTQRELAQALEVSEDTIARDLAALEDGGTMLCQKGQKIGLFDRRFGRK
jgi:DeoR/GlpR family transcriptional regulator of sugar metabolism